MWPRPALAKPKAGHGKWWQLTKKPHHGFSLIEVSVALGIGGLILGSLYQFTGLAGRGEMAASAAQQAAMVARAVDDYINNQKSTLLGLTVLSGLDDVGKICILTTDTGCKGGVQEAGYLPARYDSTSLKNIYGQSYELYIKREDGGQRGVVDDGDKLVGLLITTGGTAMPDKVMTSTASIIGAAGGAILSTGKATGTGGGWQIDFSSATGWTTSPGTSGVSVGHLAILTSLMRQRAEGQSCSGATSPVTLVQASPGNYDWGTGSPVTTTFSATPAAGNTIVVAVNIWGDPAAGILVTDNHGNTYTQVVNKNQNGSTESLLFKADNIATGSPFTVSVSYVTTWNETGGMQAFEVSGASATTPVETTGTQASSSTSQTSMTVTTDAPVTAGSLAIGTISMGFSNMPLAISYGAGWTQSYFQDDCGHYSCASMVYKQFTADGSTLSHTWTYDAPVDSYSDAAGVMMVFQGDSTSSCSSSSGTSGAVFNDLDDSVTNYTSADMFMGQSSGAALTTGIENTGIGYQALASTATNNANTAMGAYAGSLLAGDNNTILSAYDATAYPTQLLTGDRNIHLGAYTAYNVTGSNDNIAIGAYALAQMDSASTRNIVIGTEAMKMGAGSAATDNIAIGLQTVGGGSVNANAPRKYNITIDNAYGTYKCDYCTGNISIGSASNYNLIGTSGNQAIGNTVMGYAAVASSGTAGNSTGITAAGSNSCYWCTNGGGTTTMGYNSGKGTTTNPIYLFVAFGAHAMENRNISGYSIGVGAYALSGLTNGSNNTALGYYACGTYAGGFDDCVAMGTNAALNNHAGTGGITAIGYNALQANTTGLRNTAMGSSALYTNTTKDDNVSVGTEALYTAASSFNAAFGYRAGYKISSGAGHTALGAYSLGGSLASGASAVTGVTNTAVGAYALQNNTSSTGANVAIGYEAMALNTSGSTNTAIGSGAGRAATTTSMAVAVGYQSLYAATDGLNTAVGASALYSYTSSASALNVAVGYRAGYAGSATNAIKTGYRNTMIGTDATVDSTSASNRTAIGYGAVSTANLRVMVGNSSVTTIGGYANWTNFSDRRLKKDIRNTDLGYDFIMGLRPVRYHMITGNNNYDYGFIAQEVEALLNGRKTNLVHPPENSKDYYMLTLDEITPAVVRTMQLAQHQLDNLHEQADRLNASLSPLENNLAKLDDHMNSLSSGQQSTATSYETLARQQQDMAAELAQQQSDLQTITGLLQQSKPQPSHLQPINYQEQR